MTDMADTFYNPTPAVSPTNDGWSEPEATGDRWAWITTQNLQATAWHIQNQFTDDVAWYIQNQTLTDTSWHIQNSGYEDIAWHIQNQFLEDIAWAIFGRTLNYLALFVLRPLTSTFALPILTSSYSFEELKSDFKILQSLTDNFNIEHPLTASFAAKLADYGLTIDEPIDDDITIQPAEKGTKILF
jgi:hypothetical protein